MSVKICGINSREAFSAARASGADYAGFVFFARSPRHVTPAQAAAIAGSDNTILRVGLFVQPTDAEVAGAMRSVRLDILQVYAEAARARALREQFGVPVWHAVPIADQTDLPHKADGVDRLVIEAKPPAGATRPGGNAARLDWSALRGWSAPLPWILAGGLDPRNVAQAVRESGAAAVDVSSGVETAPGVKSTALIHAFVAAARQAFSAVQVPRSRSQGVP